MVPELFDASRSRQKRGPLHKSATALSEDGVEFTSRPDTEVCRPEQDPTNLPVPLQTYRAVAFVCHEVACSDPRAFWAGTQQAFLMRHALAYQQSLRTSHW